MYFALTIDGNKGPERYFLRLSQSLNTREKKSRVQSKAVARATHHTTWRRDFYAGTR